MKLTIGIVLLYFDRVYLVVTNIRKRNYDLYIKICKLCFTIIYFSWRLAKGDLYMLISNEHLLQTSKREHCKLPLASNAPNLVFSIMY